MNEKNTRIQQESSPSNKPKVMKPNKTEITFLIFKFSFKIKYSQRAPKLSSANNVDKGMLINAYYDFKNKINKAEDIKVWRKRG